MPSPALTRAPELRSYSRAQQLPTRERRRLERPFQLRVRPDRDAVHAELAGELDIAAIDHVRDVLQQLIASGPAHLEIDLRALSFIDASGLRLLLDLDAASRRDGWRLSLIQGPSPVRRLFELTATLDALPFSPGSALAA